MCFLYHRPYNIHVDYSLNSVFFLSNVHYFQLITYLYCLSTVFLFIVYYLSPPSMGKQILFVFWFFFFSGLETRYDTKTLPPEEYIFEINLYKWKTKERKCFILRVPLSKIAEEQSQHWGTIRTSRRIFQPNENHHEYVSTHRDISLTLHHRIPNRENIY